MLSRSRAWFLLSAVLMLGGGCKARETAGQDSRPLPTPEPPASPSVTLPREEAPPAKKRAADDEAKDAAAKAKPSATGSAAKAPSAPATGGSAGTAATASSAPAAVGGSGNAPVAALPSAPTFTAPSAACLSRCQGAMQGCLSAPVDGGVPGFGNLDLCKKAFEACQAACK